MVTFRQMYGAVYILENAKAQRVKVGMTINHVADRLSDANDKWMERKGTCQICGMRWLQVGGVSLNTFLAVGVARAEISFPLRPM